MRPNAPSGSINGRPEVVDFGPRWPQKNPGGSPRGTGLGTTESEKETQVRDIHPIEIESNRKVFLTNDRALLAASLIQNAYPPTSVS